MNSTLKSGTSHNSGDPDIQHNSGEPRRDWPDLFSKLAIPLVVLAATLWYTGWQSHLTDLQHQDGIMETYIGDMKDLLGQSQGSSNPNLPQTAEEQTVTTLRRLNSQRNRIVLQFLQGTHLIGAQNPHIDLGGADLSYDDLGDAPLSGTDLRNVNLSHADLAGADLSGAIMTGADLTGADLSGATLTGASLADASLAGADLSSARLGDTILTSANLGGADLGGADLGGANLPGADITQPQLNEAGSCADAVLSGPLTCRLACSFTSRFTPSCQEKPPIQLTYWYTESGAAVAVIKSLVNKFNQQNPRTPDMVARPDAPMRVTC